jgi:phosphate transport system substrate-binding protein
MVKFDRLNEPAKSRRIQLLTAAFLVIMAAGCVDEDARENLVITGSTTVLPAVERCAEVFNLAQDEIGVQVSSGGSGRGIQDAASGLADIGMASREVKESEVKQFGDHFVEHLIGYDAIAVVVSKEIYDAGVTGLSSEEVSNIYSGEIDNWKDVGGPDEMILPVARIPGSGTGDTFNEMIMGSSRAETEGVEVNAMENAEIKTLIVQSDKAIGYLGIGYAKTGDLRAVALDGVAPSAANVKNRTYKLSRPLYLYTWNGTSKTEAEFIDFVLGPEGQGILEEEGFFPAASSGPEGPA